MDLLEVLTMNLKLDSVTKKDIPVIQPEATADQTLKELKDLNAGDLIVVAQNGIPCGYLFFDDLVSEENHSRTAADIMRKDIEAVGSRDDLDKLINSNKLCSPFPILAAVSRDGKFQGIISKDKVISALYQDLKYKEGILNSLDIGLVSINMEEQIKFMNKEFERIHSLELKDVYDENIFDILPETLITAPFKSPSIEERSGPLRFKKSGVTVVPYYKPIVDHGDGMIGSVAIVKEYIDNKDLGLNLREITSFNKLFSLIFNNMSEIVFCADVNRYIFYANPEFARFFRQTPGEVIENSRINELLTEVFESNPHEKMETEFIVRNKLNDTINVKATVFPIDDVNKMTEGVVVILQDITSERTLSAEIESKASLLQYYENQINRIPKEMICISLASREVVSAALKVAVTPVSVLIEGENGVGKEMIANLIHANSDRSDKPFIPVNCGAIPENLWESEMFGYEDGAFTGAKRGGKMGIFEIADGGTVFLDEISELSLPAQVKMLRFLQNMEIAKVGRKEVKKINVRIIAAANDSLERLVKENRFRMDLYYRLNVVSLKVPPLRERREEIIPLAKNFIDMFNKRYGKNAALSKEVEPLLLSQSWPGNVRQLKNVIEHGVVMSDNDIMPYHLPLHMIREYQDSHSQDIDDHAGLNLPRHIGRLEREKIIKALAEAGNNKSKAIELLGISRKTFYKKLKDYNIIL